MIKRTLHFGNPAYLSCTNGQLVVELRMEGEKQTPRRTVPIEDIGVVVLEHPQITLTHGLMAALLDNNAVVITCDGSYMPSGLFMPLAGNTLQNEKFRAQLDASVPLKKNLWTQTIEAKIRNQAYLLAQQGINTENMLYWASSVKSGDADNHEARAAAYYWANLFPPELQFLRQRGGSPPNNLLNYGYAILRGVVARGLVASGLLPTLGIHHANKYNAYCLADDIMEPYRPFVDKLVLEIVLEGGNYEELDKTHKQRLLQIPALDIFISGERSPLMVGLQRTTASLARCFEGTTRKITYPAWIE